MGHPFQQEVCFRNSGIMSLVGWHDIRKGSYGSLKQYGRLLSVSILASSCHGTPKRRAIISNTLVESSSRSLVWLSTNWLLDHRIHQYILSRGINKDLHVHDTCKSLCGICGRYRHHASSDLWQVLLLINLNDGESARWGGVRSKGVGRKYEIDRNIFLYSDLLNLYLRQNATSLNYFRTGSCFLMRKNCTTR